MFIPSILSSENINQNLQHLEMGISLNYEFLIFVKRPDMNTAPLIIKPYKLERIFNVKDNIVNIATLTPSLADIREARPHINHIKILDIKTSNQEQWLDALSAVVDGDTALFLKKNHHVLAQLVTFQDDLVIQP